MKKWIKTLTTGEKFCQEFFRDIIISDWAKPESLSETKSREFSDRLYTGIVGRLPNQSEKAKQSSVKANSATGIEMMGSAILLDETSKRCESALTAHKDLIMTKVVAIFGRIGNKKSLSHPEYWSDVLRLFRFPAEYASLLPIDVSKARSQMDFLWKKHILAKEVRPINPENKMAWILIADMISDMSGPGGAFADSKEFKEIANAILISLSIDESRIPQVQESDTRDPKLYHSPEVDKIMENVEIYEAASKLLAPWNDDARRQTEVFAGISKAYDDLIGEGKGFEYFAILVYFTEQNNGVVDSHVHTQMDLSYHRERIEIFGFSTNDHLILPPIKPINDYMKAALRSRKNGLNLTDEIGFPEDHKFTVHGVNFYVSNEVSTSDAASYRETMTLMSRMDPANFQIVANNNQKVYITQYPDGGILDKAFAMVTDYGFVINMPSSQSLHRGHGTYRADDTVSILSNFEILGHEFQHLVQFSNAGIQSVHDWAVWAETHPSSMLEKSIIHQMNFFRAELGIPARISHSSILIPSYYTQEELDGGLKDLPLSTNPEDLQTYKDSLTPNSLRFLNRIEEFNPYKHTHNGLFPAREL